MMLYTRKSARAIVITKDNELCLIKRTKNGEIYWVAPGGGIEEGETPLEAVKRELLEETGSVCVGYEKVIEFENMVFFLCYEEYRVKATGQEYATATDDNKYEIVNLDINTFKDINFKPEKVKMQVYNVVKPLLRL